VFNIVGITSKTISGPRVYINYSMFSKLTGRNDQVNEVRIRTDLDKIISAEQQEALATLVEDRFSSAGLSDSSASTRYQVFGFFTEPFAIILMVLVIMAGLLAVVGGLSLAGTMGINVMERTREIGVLRSVGASNTSVREVVVVEGVMIAILSWVLVTLISGPSSASLAGAVIYTVLKTNLTFRYSFAGLGLWLLIVVIIGIFSSLAPAQNAVSLTVREVLDYE
jgi:putative ABC transport system permease protein